MKSHLRRRFERADPHSRDRVLVGWFRLLRFTSWLIAPIIRLRFNRSGIVSDRLHVGSGAVRLEGWINTDVHPRAQLVVDVRRRLPFPDGRFQWMYCEHLIEHLSPAEGVRFLAEARRTLIPGGVLRVAMPDLATIVEAYHGDWQSMSWLSMQGHEFIDTPAAMLNVAFRWWDHKWLYDRHELERRLVEAGFQQIEFQERGRSRHPVLSGLETRDDSLLIAEATRT